MHDKMNGNGYKFFTTAIDIPLLPRNFPCFLTQAKAYFTASISVDN